jgi:hypothetical protein
MSRNDRTKLDQQGYERHRDRPHDDLLQDFRAASIQMLRLVEGMGENDIFTKKLLSLEGKFEPLDLDCREHLQALLPGKATDPDDHNP